MGKTGSYSANRFQDKIATQIPKDGMFSVPVLLMMVLAVWYLCTLPVECQLFRI